MRPLLLLALLVGGCPAPEPHLILSPDGGPLPFMSTSSRMEPIRVDFGVGASDFMYRTGNAPTDPVVFGFEDLTVQAKLDGGWRVTVRRLGQVELVGISCPPDSKLRDGGR